MNYENTVFYIRDVIRRRQKEKIINSLLRNIHRNKTEFSLFPHEIVCFPKTLEVVQALKVFTDVLILRFFSGDQKGKYAYFPSVGTDQKSYQGLS